ncbi:MAG: tetratricopeptide repeat-containing sulfotransferase family protein [Steroidobacteraceae bacterium]
MKEPAEAAHRDVLRLMQAGDWRAADAACRRITERYPSFAAGWYSASRIGTALGSPATALEAIDRALSVEPANASYLVLRARCQLALNHRRAALDTADAAARCDSNDPAVWDAIGTLRSYANDQQRALLAYDRAVTLAPQASHFIYNRAAVRRFLGDLDAAEADYDRVIALRPLDYEAYWNRSELRVQTASRNHVRELQALAAGDIANWLGEVQIRFALAKEYEDLGEYAQSFEQLRIGCKMRRDHMKYDVGTDVATVDWIMSAFPTGPTDSAPNAAAEAPIFILGLPRSGTTLVERILSSHSLVSSAGELDCFASAIVDAVRERSGQAQLPRQKLVALSAGIDFSALGVDYMQRARGTFDGDRRFIDKMPLNYLYCGLIRRALPNAKIIHVTRHPMAACYAMYKTLFKRGYPFSYDLGEIAQYYVAYRRLMQHWHATMPGTIHDIRYEHLVADQRDATRELLMFCGLDWEEACTAFHENPAAATTASASQVRRPLYESSVSQWRHYEAQLADLSSQLRAAGISVAT